MAEVPKKLDRWGVKHEIVALILTGIRGSREKRLSDAVGRSVRFATSAPTRGATAGGQVPPIILYAYQRKGVTETAFRKLLILKGAILVVLG
jgi:hypothetical protein